MLVVWETGIFQNKELLKGKNKWGLWCGKELDYYELIPCLIPQRGFEAAYKKVLIIRVNKLKKKSG